MKLLCHVGLWSSAALTRLRAVLAWRDVQLLAGIFLAIQVLDAVTTWLALRTPRFTEGNPWLDQAVATDPLLTYAAKLTIALGVVTSLLLIRMRWRLRDCVLAIFAVISLIAPASNALRLAGWLS
jgi:hypothetical protein